MNASDNPAHILLVGAGLTGALLSIFLAKRGFRVSVYEKRPDPCLYPTEEGRSINLALSHRGIRALKQVGLDEYILQHALPMRGRLLHSQGQDDRYVPYGKDDSYYINSISRSRLNSLLIEEARRYPLITFYFEHVCEGVDFEKNTVFLRHKPTEAQVIAKADVIMGVDGAGSAVRKQMQAQHNFEQSVDFLEHGYKELTIPPTASGDFAIRPDALHIWPRKSFMLIALPNVDKSFTCTLFLANEGPVSFNSLQSTEAVEDFFDTHFADVKTLMPQLSSEFLKNPVGLLGTLRCNPWYRPYNALLLGDAAHAIVPFYGQGMNASFEDCLVLDQCIETYGRAWAKVFERFQQLRKPNTDAIAALAIENFYEMRDGVTEEAFLRMKQLEHQLENTYPDYRSKYSMVTFSPEMSYAEAQRLGNLQNEWLLAFCRQQTNLSTVNLEEVYRALKTAVPVA